MRFFFLYPIYILGRKGRPVTIYEQTVYTEVKEHITQERYMAPARSQVPGIGDSYCTRKRGLSSRHPEAVCLPCHPPRLPHIGLPVPQNLTVLRVSKGPSRLLSPADPESGLPYRSG